MQLKVTCDLINAHEEKFSFLGVLVSANFKSYYINLNFYLCKELKILFQKALSPQHERF